VLHHASHTSVDPIFIDAGPQGHMYLVMAYGLGGFTALCAAIAGVGAQGDEARRRSPVTAGKLHQLAGWE